MTLQIVNSQRDNEELKYYEDVYTSEDNITVDGKQLPSFTIVENTYYTCLLYTSPSPRDATLSRMPSSA